MFNINTGLPTHPLTDSNTTLVNVQQTRYMSVGSCCSRIQIQHLLLFNKIVRPFWSGGDLFKYNTCYCSTGVGISCHCWQQDSNTILVTVQQNNEVPLWLRYAHSNTILVTVQLSPVTPILQSNGHSNTILVTVQRCILSTRYGSPSFKYNTCYCSTRLAPRSLYGVLFKYNTCYCSTEWIRWTGNT